MTHTNQNPTTPLIGKRNMKIILHNTIIAFLCFVWIIPIVWLV